MLETMSRCERLERWASVLDAVETPVLSPFREVEFLSDDARRDLRVANSPLAIAYRDPVLRRAGLSGERYGEGAAFFGLSRFQAHRVLCSCGYFGPMRATEVARRLRAIAARERLRRLLPSLNPLPVLARWRFARRQAPA